MTIKEALNAMAEPYRTQALTNCETQGRAHRANVDKISEALMTAFMREETPEDFDYWDAYYDTLLNLGL